MRKNINEGYRRVKAFDDLSKLPDDLLLSDLKRKYAELVQHNAANEEYIHELEQEKEVMMHRTDEDKAAMRKEQYVQNLVEELNSLRRKCKELTLIRDRYLAKIMYYERIHHTGDSQQRTSGVSGTGEEVPQGQDGERVLP